MPKQAALYLRSSKDRSAISLAAQRHELQSLAQTKNLLIAEEYSDAVESGKDTNRAGFQKLLRDLKAKGRTWSAILMYDTSRLGRRRHIAEVFRHECKKLGVELHFLKIPETDPISQVILESVFQAMDEVHSLMSREKGLAGMAENVRQGFRAGGRAPYGYKLQVIDTGNVRDGEAVTKSKLAIDDATGPKIAAYLNGRAAGKSSARLADELGIKLASSSLSHLEWTALTYAGHTVWNMHRGDEEGAGQERRRPRSEWIIQRDTHPALISDEIAEALLTRREGKAATRATRDRRSDYLLSGILITPDGRAWHGAGGAYSAPGGNIKAAALEQTFLEAIAKDLTGDFMVQGILAQARLAQMPSDGGELEQIRRQIREVETGLSRLVTLAEQSEEPGPLLRRMEERERERADLVEQMARMGEETKRAKAMAAIKESDVRKLLIQLAEDLADLDRDHLKDFLRGCVERLVLDPATRSGAIHYRIGSEVKMASPRGTETNLGITTTVPFQGPKNRKAA